LPAGKQHPKKSKLIAMIRKHVPNAITCLNLLSGCIALVYGLDGAYPKAALFVGLAALFDFLDGLAARTLKAYSPMGKELDSLADLVSFGVVPGAMIYRFLETQAFLSGTYQWIAWSGMLIPIFSALRLAKFNLDERQTSSFLGLPTPANAIFWVSGLGTSIPFISEFKVNPYIVLVGIILFCWLMVSNLPMFSLKFKNLGWKGNQIRYGFLTGCIILLVHFGIQGIAPCILWYILLSLSSVTFIRKTD
jgi:CDP-diacylglycerol---serine O-phosphatidyltransferase